MSTGLDTKTVGGWIVTILLALFTGTLASNARSSEIEKDGREYRVRIDALEKNQEKILKLVDDTHTIAIELKANKESEQKKVNP